MTAIEIADGAIDVCGTGGDGAGTLNVSSAVTFVVAGAGVKVAKHGNRAASSKSGSSDVLGALNVKIGLSPEHVSQCIAEAGIGFMMAQTHHAAMRHVGPVRVELGTRTIFNILGPLSNPAGVTRQVIGTFSRALLQPMAQVLHNMGSTHVWLVHGSDGLDELTTTGPTHVVQLRDGAITEFDVHPEDAGLPQAKADDLKGGDPAHNAAALRAVLEGGHSAYRDIAVFNTAAALMVAGKADTLKQGASLASDALQSGKAKAVLARLVDVSNRS
jgi:anthranilate phosphoribosyltransferase